MRCRVLLVLLGLLVHASLSRAHADRLVVIPRGGGDPKSIEPLMAPGQALVRAGRPTAFPGRVIELVYDDAEPAARVPLQGLAFRVLPYSNDGQRLAATPVTLRASDVSWENEYDDVLDLRRILSNRDQLLDVPVGHPTHRAAIHALVDPDGSMGLARGGSPPAVTGRVEEGWLELELARGPVSDHEIARSVLQRPYPVRTMWTEGSAARLLEGVARARRYPAIFEESFADQAAATFAMLLELDRAVPDLAPSGRRGATARASQVGVHMRWAFEGALAGTAIPITRESPPLLPITAEEVTQVALRLLVADPVFDDLFSTGMRPFDPAEPLDYSDHSGRGAYTLTLLLRGATGVVDSKTLRQPSAGTTELARQALLRLMRSGARGPFNEGKRFHWVREVQGRLFGPEGHRRFLLDVLREFGWGTPDEVRRLVDHAASIASSESGLTRELDNPLVRHRREASLSLLAAIAGGGTTSESRQYPAFVDDVRRRTEGRVLEAEGQGRRDSAAHKFLALLDAALARGRHPGAPETK